MSDHVYKQLELTGSSNKSIEDAVDGAVRRAAKTMHGLRWIQVTEIRGDVDGDHVNHWQVSMKLGFTLD